MHLTQAFRGGCVLITRELAPSPSMRAMLQCSRLSDQPFETGGALLKSNARPRQPLDGWAIMPPPRGLLPASLAQLNENSDESWPATCAATLCMSFWLVDWDCVNPRRPWTMGARRRSRQIRLPDPPRLIESVCDPLFGWRSNAGSATWNRNHAAASKQGANACWFSPLGCHFYSPDPRRCSDGLRQQRQGPLNMPTGPSGSFIMPMTDTHGDPCRVLPATTNFAATRIADGASNDQRKVDVDA